MGHPRHVIQIQGHPLRQLRGLAEVSGQSLGVIAVVIGRGDRRRVGALMPGPVKQLLHVRQIHGRGVEQNTALRPRSLHRRRQEPFPLLQRQIDKLSSGAADEDAVYSCIRNKLGQPRVFPVVDAPVLPKGGQLGGGNTAQTAYFGHGVPLLS